VEPGHEDEVAPLLDLCLHELPGSAYLRLVTPPVDVPYQLPPGYRPLPGRGLTLREGEDAVIFGYGPVLLTQAFLAAGALGKRHGLEVAVIDLPWLNVVDGPWLASATAGKRLVVTLDNHYLSGGQGQMLLASLAGGGRVVPALQRGVTSVPACGTNDEVLAFHRLDAASITDDILAALAERNL